MSDDIKDEGGIIDNEPLGTALGDRYLTYALSTIMNRALPDARDGLKPVHRRILFAMRGLRLEPTGAFRKSAKIVGEVMGNYHPHGDQAIYDALARLAQDFSIRYPLVDGQGNFGNIDGDNPAAQRYTEARMTHAAVALLEGLTEDAVDFQDNYDGSEREPVVLPAAYPQLLANGSSGIAVGMATNIPPHNLDELIKACKHLIKTPEARDETLMNYVQGPDFPTGGVIIDDKDTISEAYIKGKGSFRVRARWHKEELARGAWQIVVTEIPYQVQKSRLVEKLAELIDARKVPILGDIKDESAEDIRLVIEPKTRSVDPDMLMQALFKNSDLESRFSMNMNVLIDGRVPQVSSLKTILRAFLDHRRDVLGRRTRHRLDKIAKRLEILDGYLVAYLNLDRVIEIIRYEDEPKAMLIKEFSLTDGQAEAILNMRLRALRKLEEIEIRNERDALLAEQDELNTLMDDVDLQWKTISNELTDVAKKFGATSEGGQRRTTFELAADMPDVSVEAMIEREPVTVICSQMGWIRAMKGHVALDGEYKFKDGDGPRIIFHAETTDKLILAGSHGRFYTLAVNDLPGGRGMGEPVRLMTEFPQDAEIVDLFVHQPERQLIVASSGGNGFIVSENDMIAQTKNGKQVMNLASGERLRLIKPVSGDSVAVIGDNRKLIVFPLEELPQMARGKGNRLQKYKDGGLSDLTTFTRADGLTWHDPAGRTRKVTELDDWLGKRAGTGRMAPRGFPRDNKFN